MHEKLGAHRAALKDARRMMAVAPASPRGYLRAGKVLQLMRLDAVAAATYRYGLERVPAAERTVGPPSSPPRARR